MPLQREDSLKRSCTSEPRHEIIFKIGFAAEWRSGKLQGARLKGSWREKKAIQRHGARANAGKGIGVEFGFRFWRVARPLRPCVSSASVLCCVVCACVRVPFLFLLGGGAAILRRPPPSRPKHSPRPDHFESAPTRSETCRLAAALPHMVVATWF